MWVIQNLVIKFNSQTESPIVRCHLFSSDCSELTSERAVCANVLLLGTPSQPFVYVIFALPIWCLCLNVKING